MKLIVEVFFRLLHYIATLYLPVVFGAVASLEGFVLSFFNSGKNIDIFVININAENKRKKIILKSYLKYYNENFLIFRLPYHPALLF